MSSGGVKEIVDAIYYIYELDFESIDYDYYDELRSMTHSVWETNHAELLRELKNLDAESDVDFQLFWYDCLGFYQRKPKIFLKNGLPANVLYGDICNDIDIVVSQIGGYHDLNFNYVTYEDDLLSLYLDMRSWGIISKIDYQIKLTFKDVSNIQFYKYCVPTEEREEFSIEKLMGNHILSARELPMIDYIFNNLSLDKEGLVPGKRLFWINISGEGCLYHMYFSFDGWDHEKLLDKQLNKS